MERHQTFLLPADISDFCRERLSELFSSGVPDFASERLEYELRFLADDSVSEHLAAYHAISEAARKSGHLISVLGAAAGSMLVYLLGSGNINPLPAYHYCSECGYWEQSDNNFCLDTEQKHCPKCSALMLCKGFSIPASLLTERSFQLEYRFADGFVPFAYEALRSLFSSTGRETAYMLRPFDGEERITFSPCGFVIMPGPVNCNLHTLEIDGRKCVLADEALDTLSDAVKIRFGKSDILTAIQNEQNRTGIFADSISTDMLREISLEDMVSTGMMTADEYCSAAGAGKTFLDIAKRITEIRNSYQDEDCDTVSSLEMRMFSKEIYSFREEVYEDLIAAGAGDDQAVSDTKKICKGYRVIFPEEYDALTIPESMKDRADRCGYLFPRAYGAQRLLRLMTLAWYRKR